MAVTKKNIIAISSMIDYNDKQLFIPSIIFIDMSNLGVNIVNL